MSAIDELMAKEDMTKLEKVVHLVYGWDESLCWLAEDAAAELAALRRVAEAARAAHLPNHVLTFNELCELYAEIRNAVREYDKCRAA